jgi:glutamine synthetase
MITWQSHARTHRMAEKQTTGTLAGGELRDLAARGEVEVVWAITPDQYGRPIGKRFAARYFVDEVLERQSELPARILFNDLAGELVPPPSTVRVDPAATLRCRPDIAALRRAAWLEGTAIAVCDLVAPVGDELYGFSPRAALKRQLDRARSASLTPRASFELSFYLRAATLDRSAAGSRALADHTAVSADGGGADAVRAMQRLLGDSGVAVQHIVRGVGPGQFRIALQSVGLLEAADRAMIVKWLVKEVAGRFSQTATFMALPDSGSPASAMDVQVGLWSADREVALFASRDQGEHGTDLPPACRWWLGGLIAHARDSTLLLAPTVNSYKRYRKEAGGSAIGWTHGRPGLGFAVTGDGARRQVASSLAGADANPYLVGAALLAAGLDGMASRSEPPAPAGTEPSSLRALPKVAQDIVEAADLASRSGFIRQALGEQYVDYLAHCARWEQARCAAAVTSWEVDRYGREV